MSVCMAAYLSICLSPHCQIIHHIPLSLLESIYSNCMLYFFLKASQRALVAVENQSAKTLEAQKIKRNLQAVRKVSQVK